MRSKLFSLFVTFLISALFLTGCASGPLSLDTEYVPAYAQLPEELALNSRSSFNVDSAEPIFAQQPEPVRLNIPDVQQGQSFSVEIRRDGNGYPILMMGMAFTLAWEEMGVALKQTEFTIKDLDRSNGIYTLKSVKSSSSNPLIQNSGELQIILRQTSSGVEVTVQRDDAELAPLPVSNRIIEELFSELSQV